MPLIKKSDYRSPFYLLNGDMQTIVPALFRKVDGVNYVRERITTSDYDFIDLDWSFSRRSSNKLILISHGLEGNTFTQYTLGMARAFNYSGYDALAWNYRGCSGEMNKVFRFYHSGETNDLDVVVNHAVSKGYKEIILIGFSIGGNITLKYLGEGRQLSPRISGAVCFSVPCHLESVAWHLARFRSKIYMNRFLKSLKDKVRTKAQAFPGRLNLDELEHIENFHEFDSWFTAPVNGFKSAEEYWAKSSSLYYLKDIYVPTLLINAVNDPFLTKECFPIKEAEKNPFLFLEIPEKGGHCGFTSSNNNGIYWSELRAVNFAISLKSINVNYHKTSD